MTVPVQTPLVAYTANGIATVFTFPFRIIEAEDLQIEVAGVPITSGFTLAGLGADEGTVTFSAPPATGSQVLLYRSIALERDTDYQNNGDFNSPVVNADFDRIWMALQDIGDQGTRAVHYPIEEFGTDGTLPIASERAGNVLGFDANGKQTMIPLPASVGAGDLRDDVFVAGVGFTPGTTTSFTLSRAPGSTANVFAWWDDIPQFNFTLAGNVATFSAAPPADITKVRFRTGTTLSLNTPALHSVGDDSLAPGSNIFALNNYHWRVRTDPNNNYDGVDQSGFPEASPLVYTEDGESFGWSMRNSKHTAFELYQAVNGVGTQFYDGVQSVTVLAAGSNIGQATGVAGYIRNICANAGGHPNAVALFGLGTAEVDNSDTWGVNTLLQDAPTRAFGSGLGRLLLGYENDINVMNPDTQVIGVSVGGNSLANPKASNAFIANALGGPAIWGTSFWSTDGNSLRSLVTGRNGPLVENAASQEMWWMYADSAGAEQIGIMSFQPAGGSAPGGAWTFTGTAKSSMALANGDFNAVSGVYRVASAQVVGAQIPGYGTPLNGTRQSGFNASTATLPQTAAMLAALMTDLKQHGLIGV